MQILAERVQRGSARAMEMDAVFLEPVVGSEVHAAAEPEHGRFAAAGGDEEAHIHVYGRNVGIARMQHQGHAHRLETPTGEFLARRARRGRQFAAAHSGEGDASSLEEGALFDDAGVPASCIQAGRFAFLGIQARRFGFASLPGVAAERVPVDTLQFRDDAVLKSCQVIFDEIDVHVSGTAVRSLSLGCATGQRLRVAGARWPGRVSMARWPMSRRHCMPSKRMPSTTW